MKFRAIKDGDKLNINWERVGVYLSRFKDGAAFDVEITHRKRVKTDPIRRYYYGVVLPLFMDHLGYERDETDLFHRQLKIVYFRVKPDAKGIYRNVPLVFSEKSDMPIEEKAKFLEWVVRKAAAEGVYIQDAKEEM